MWQKPMEKSVETKDKQHIISQQQIFNYTIASIKKPFLH